MKEKLKAIRAPAEKPAAAAVKALLCLLAGIALGVLSKWLDTLAPDGTIWWQGILEKLDLGNVFSGMAIWLLLALAIAVFSPSPGQAAVRVPLFFAGMCAAYHLYTVLVCGFHPTRYMMLWYGITLLSPALAALCWYGRGTHPASIALDALLFAALAMQCFSVGWIYFYFNGAVNAAIFLAAALVLYRSPKQTAISLPTGLAFAVLLRPLLPF